MAGSVVRISIAPVKALHLVHPDEVELTRAGVVGDRRFWLRDADWRLANGKRFPQLMQIRPEWDEETRRLAFELPGGERIEGVVEPGEPVRVGSLRNVRIRRAACRGRGRRRSPSSPASR